MALPPRTLPMKQYYFEDFPAYSEYFSQHSIRIAELMRILHEKVETELGPEKVKVTAKDLFRLTTEIMYNVDSTYREEKGIKEESSFINAFDFQKDEIISEMRTLLREEIKRYFDGTDK